MSPHATLEATRKGLFFFFTARENEDTEKCSRLCRATKVWTWDPTLDLSEWKVSMNSGDLQKQMAIVFQHPVGLNASFEDERLHRLLFSFRFYA